MILNEMSIREVKVWISWWMEYEDSLEAFGKVLLEICYMYKGYK